MTGNREADITIRGIRLPLRDGLHAIMIHEGVVRSVEPDTQTSRSTPWLALPGLVNLHAHADRAFTAPELRPSSLGDAIEMSSTARSHFTVADIACRASRFFQRSIVHGAARVRTHIDVDPLVDLRSMEAICGLRDSMRARIKIDIVAFSTAKNDLLSADGSDRLKAAVAMGADLVGAGLNFSNDPARSIAVLLDLAERHGVLVDVHMDEHLAPERMLIPQLIEAVLARDLRGRVTLSHACVLAALESGDAARLIDGLARSEITVVALPETNLFLQDRGAGTPKHRGITLVRELLGAGVEVRLGTDNVRDWFFPYGDGDVLETGYLAAISAHMDEPRALLRALCDGRADIVAGDPADLVLIPADSFDDAIARRPGGRVAIVGGQVVSGALPSFSPPSDRQ